MSVSLTAWFVVNWDAIAEETPEGQRRLLCDANEYLLFLGGDAARCPKPTWCEAFELPASLQSGRARFWASESFEKLVRPELGASAAAVVEAWMLDMGLWIGPTGDTPAVQDLGAATAYTGLSSGTALALSPASVHRLRSEWNSLSQSLRSARPDAWVPPDGGTDPWFVSHAAWLDYVAHWARLLQHAARCDAGVIVEAG